MDKLKEIFKSNKKLLKEPEVQELITYCQSIFTNQRKQITRLKNHEDIIIDLCFKSEVFAIGGKDSKEVIKKIIELD